MPKSRCYNKSQSTDREVPPTKASTFDLFEFFSKNLIMNGSRNDSKLNVELLEELAVLNTRNDVITFFVWIGLIETGVYLLKSIGYGI
ncbi:Neuronal acetylcholine receptor [Trichinella pseudospiralis]